MRIVMAEYVSPLVAQALAKLRFEIEHAESADELAGLWDNYRRLWTDEHTVLARKRKRELKP
jgi:hypothetical protein